MKTYTTSGTGSQQTLSEIESDKMPIYNTMADAEADLANLEIGQIIAINTIGAERLAYVVNENGTKKIKDLTANVGTGAPVGSYLYLEKKSNPQGYLYCDGSTFDSSVYPALYQYLGSNVLPDWREFSAVGAEQNTTNVYDANTNPSGVIHDHDVYAEGESKDDQLQNHYHDSSVLDYDNTGAHSSVGLRDATTTDGGWNSFYIRVRDVNSARYGSVTRGKSKAVFIYIKATSGLTENQQENVLNTINDNNSYSTEEHPTGKKWIDGKDIYSIVLTTTTQINADDMSFGGLATIISNLNIDTAIYAGGIDNTNRKTFRPLLFSSTSGFQPFGSGLAPNSKIILEYTKTTD